MPMTSNDKGEPRPLLLKFAIYSALDRGPPRAELKRFQISQFCLPSGWTYTIRIYQKYSEMGYSIFVAPAACPYNISYILIYYGMVVRIYIYKYTYIPGNINSNTKDLHVLNCSDIIATSQESRLVSRNFPRKRHKFQVPE